MLHALRSVASLLLGAGILVLGNSLVNIALPIRMHAGGWPSETAGLVMSAYFAGFVLGSLYGKTIILRVGHVRAFAAFAAMVSAAVLLYPLWEAAWPWAVLRAVGGFCIASLFTTIESWLNARSANAGRGRILSLYMVTVYLGAGGGQLLVNAWSVEGVELFTLAGLLMSLSLVPVMLTRVAGPELGRTERLGFAELYRISPLGVAGAFGAGIMSGAFFGMGPIFGRAMELSVFHISLLMGSAVLGGLVLQYPAGWLSDRFDRRTVLSFVLLVALVVCAGAYAWSVLGGGGLTPLLVLIALYGGAATTIYPISVSHAFDFVARERMIEASSGLLLAWSLGATIGPLAASAAMGRFGPAGLFLVLGLVAALLGLFTRYRMRRREGKPPDEQAKFVPLPVAGAASRELDPRTQAPTEIVDEDGNQGL